MKGKNKCDYKTKIKKNTYSKYLGIPKILFFKLKQNESVQNELHCH